MSNTVLNDKDARYKGVQIVGFPHAFQKAATVIDVICCMLRVIFGKECKVGDYKISGKRMFSRVLTIFFLIYVVVKYMCSFCNNSTS